MLCRICLLLHTHLLYTPLTTLANFTQLGSVPPPVSAASLVREPPECDAVSGLSKGTLTFIKVVNQMFTQGILVHIGVERCR